MGHECQTQIGAPCIVAYTYTHAHTLNKASHTLYPPRRDPNHRPHSDFRSDPKLFESPGAMGSRFEAAWRCKLSEGLVSSEDF